MCGRVKKLDDDVASVPGRVGWDGEFSTSLHVDPHEEMVDVLMAQIRPSDAHAAFSSISGRQPTRLWKPSLYDVRNA